MLFFGVLLLCVGFFLRFAAVICLKAEWADYPRTPKRIVKTGIYRFLSHPAYIGSVFIFSGAYILAPLKFHFIINILIFALILWNRIQIEKKIIQNLEYERRRKN